MVRESNSESIWETKSLTAFMSVPKSNSVVVRGLKNETPLTKVSGETRNFVSFGFRYFIFF